MGAYLSTPITDKETFEGEGPSVSYGGSSMQGWRRTMEDAHLAETALSADPETAIFGVFDGHGGAEVAKFCQRYMADEFTRLKGVQEATSVEDALVKVFHRMDEMLRDNKYQEELEALKTKETNKEDDGDDDHANGTMDALDLLKRVFQLKRFMGGEGGAAQGGEGAAGSAGPGGSAASNAFRMDEAADPDEGLVQAGCTAVVAVKRGNELFVANAGDSRGVLARNGKAIALSEDHKPAQELERSRIIAAGGFLSEIGGVCRVNGNLNLSRAIGDLKYKGNQELHPKDQIITAQPDIRHFTLTPDDRFFVLACDGVWDVMTNQDVVDFIGSKLDQGLTPSQAASALLDACLANDPKEARGVGCDNMTSVVVVLKPGGSGRGSGSGAAAGGAETAVPAATAPAPGQ